MTRFLPHTALVLGLLMTASTTPATAQPTVDGFLLTQLNPGAGTGGLDQLQVEVLLAASEVFNLGNATLMFTFNEAALALPSGPAINQALDPATDYAFVDPYINDPGAGKFYLSSSVTVFGASNRLSINLVLDLANLGQALPVAATPVVRLFFDIIDTAQTADLSWIVVGDANPTVVFQDDNQTAVALGTFSDENTLLPVELVSFEAQVDGTQTRLSWTTASETNNAGFEVQHLANEQGTTPASPEDWRVLGFVEGHGTTLETQRYTFLIEDLAPGRHVFRLKQLDYDGRFEYSPQVEVVVALVEAYRLSPAYPNPFNPRTQFSLSVQRRQHVRVLVYDLLGRQVARLFDEELLAGQSRALVFEAGSLPSGLYFIRAEGETFVATERVTLVK